MDVHRVLEYGFMYTILSKLYTSVGDDVDGDLWIITSLPTASLVHAVGLTVKLSGAACRYRHAIAMMMADISNLILFICVEVSCGDTLRSYGIHKQAHPIFQHIQLWIPMLW